MSSYYKVVQIWPGQTVTCLHANSPGHIWTTLYNGYFYFPFPGEVIDNELTASVLDLTFKEQKVKILLYSLSPPPLPPILERAFFIEGSQSSPVFPSSSSSNM